LTSVSLKVTSALDAEKFQAWIGHILQTQGQDILRTKGILSYKNEDRRFGFQAVHMMADGDFLRPWHADEARVSRIVFIGRGLNRPQLRRGFESCAA
ncbi:MAG: cobalamin biosynthesis protein CobW, partial [Acidocella sp. 20-61-6]